MNIKPLADRVLILPAPAEEKTIGGIIIPDTAKEKTVARRSGSRRQWHERRRNGTESRRPSIVWQIFGYRNRTRRCEIPDYAPKRCTRNPQLRIKN